MIDDRCPRCQKERLRHWKDLTDDEREVVRRLPGSVEFPATERLTIHRWCSNCWYEATEGEHRG